MQYPSANIYSQPYSPIRYLPGMGAGTRIKELRISRGMTQAKLAKAAGISQPSLSDLERGESKVPRGSTLVRLATALESNPHYIETGKGHPTPQTSVDFEESELLAVYRALNPANRSSLLSMARVLLDNQPNEKPSKTKPFTKKVPA